MDQHIFKGNVLKKNITEVEMKISPSIIGLIVIIIAFLILAVMVLTQELNEFILLIPIFIFGYLTYSFYSLKNEYRQKTYEIIKVKYMIEL